MRQKNLELLKTTLILIKMKETPGLDGVVFTAQQFHMADLI